MGDGGVLAAARPIPDYLECEVTVRFWRSVGLSLVVLMTLTLALGAWAQDSSDDADDTDDGSPASISLLFDRQGAVNVRVNLPSSATASDALPGILTQALHCRTGAVGRAAEEPLPNFVKNWSEAKQERYRKQMAALNEHVLTGDCSSALTRNAGLLQGDFDYSAVAAELRHMGVDELTIFVSIPKTRFHDFTPTNLPAEPYRSNSNVVYRFPLKADAKIPVLHLGYGFRQADLLRALWILAGFIFVPVVVTLWMRRAALGSAKVDPAGAWFGFFRSLNWLVNAAMLLWITSGFGARRSLQEWVAGLGLSTWQAAVADVAVATLPALLIYFPCVALSYRVHEQMRGRQWTRWEFMSRQLVTVGATWLPLMLTLAALGIARQQPEFSVALLIASFGLMQLLQILKLRTIKELPQPLATGELRDRIFALAGKLGVSVSQIFVLPAGKGQVANAYAAKNKIVMFTDYLLEHLSKREVDGVAAHELAHLQHKHVGKRGAVLAAAIFLPYYFTGLSRVLMSLTAIPLGLLSGTGVNSARVILACERGLSAFEQWSQKDFVLLMLGMTAFYFVSRHYENQADATAVRLTGDPEAQITGLLRISRLNFTPLQWGKISESWLTHPSMVRRAHRMAAAGGMAPEKLQEILVRYNAESVARDAVMPAVAAEDRYPVPAVADAEKMRAALQRQTRRQGKVWVTYVMYVSPLALVSVAIHKSHLGGNAATLAYWGGLFLTAALLTLTSVWLGESGREGEKARLRARFERDHVGAGRDGDIFVGYAPGPYPRIYGTRYHWDSGFLVLAKDRLQFVGEQAKFSLAASEIDGIVTGRGGPSWWKFERVYIRWKTGDGRNGIFNLNYLEPGSIWQTRARVRALCRQLQEWHAGAQTYPEVRAELAGLGGIEVRQITSVSPDKFGGFGVNLKILATLLPLAIGVAVLAHADILYMCGSVVALRLYQSVPYWRFRDVAPAFPQAGPVNSSKAMSASAAGDAK